MTDEAESLPSPTTPMNAQQSWITRMVQQDSCGDGLSEGLGAACGGRQRLQRQRVARDARAGEALVERRTAARQVEQLVVVDVRQMRESLGTRLLNGAVDMRVA